MRNRLIALLFPCLFATNALAIEQIEPFDNVKWQSSQGVDFCQITLGDESADLYIAIKQVAGEKIRLTATNNGHFDLSHNQIILSSESAPWTRTQQTPLLIRLESVSHNKNQAQNVREQTLDVQQLLKLMNQGSWLSLNSRGHKIILPTTNASEYLSKFWLCSGQLPQISIDQASDVTYFYPSGSVTVTKHEKDKLLIITELIKRDNRIKKVLIDGHSDSAGDPVANLQLSKERAAKMAIILVKNGVNKNMIEVRGHGSRYPLTNSQGKKINNRRVQMRLVMDYPNTTNLVEELDIKETNE
ncbi:OmpA family protein [Vibrio sp. SS-MA-C1-2]|uniref:OmpA family protein n=1 Tax=Vibrio sp. SS-MA-C1-2 TaxID=2908646 RepID=UPI001F467BC7|nr:OmpA family protein [Vibrio sp. SS-MA-C1-2]UJF18027.1 OmpA family protein [Vibrio sp. SS-MA-C1-2]